MTAHLLKRTTNEFKCGGQVGISVGHRGRAKSNERLGAKCAHPPPKRVRGSSSAADAAVVIPRLEPIFGSMQQLQRVERGVNI